MITQKKLQHLTIKGDVFDYGTDLTITNGEKTELHKLVNMMTSSIPQELECYKKCLCT